MTGVTYYRQAKLGDSRLSCAFEQVNDAVIEEAGLHRLAQPPNGLMPSIYPLQVYVSTMYPINELRNL